VFVPSTDDSVYSLSESTGTQNWKFTTGGPITGGLTLTNAALVFGSADGHQYVLSPSTGTDLYKITMPGAVEGVAGAGSFLLSLGTTGWVQATKPWATNHDAWSETIGTSLTGAPTIVNGEVFIPGRNDTVTVWTVPGQPVV
jgi:outer membrane protein assembly factor BamB